VSSTDKPTFGQGAAVPFSFNNRSVSMASVGTTGSDSAAAEGDAAQPTHDGPVKDLAAASGEGEEGEETILEQRARLYTLVEGKWAVKGLGIFKVKKSKDDGKRRLLMRTEGSGHVALVSASSAMC
jgi:nucleoporin NUP2